MQPLRLPWYDWSSTHLPLSFPFWLTKNKTKWTKAPWMNLQGRYALGSVRCCLGSTRSLQCYFTSMHLIELRLNTESNHKNTQRSSTKAWTSWKLKGPIDDTVGRWDKPSALHVNMIWRCCVSLIASVTLLHGCKLLSDDFCLLLFGGFGLLLHARFLFGGD